MTEGALFRKMMYSVVQTRTDFRKAMQLVLKRNNTGITFEMLQILTSLWHEQGISQQILAERTAKDKACMTGLMSNLEKKGYIIRREDPSDRRNKLVFLTEEGERFSEKIKPVLADIYSRAEKAAGVEKIEEILDSLAGIRSILEKL